jgi:hypothetical protein
MATLTQYAYGTGHRIVMLADHSSHHTYLQPGHRNGVSDQNGKDRNRLLNQLLDRIYLYHLLFLRYN